MTPVDLADLEQIIQRHGAQSTELLQILREVQSRFLQVSKSAPSVSVLPPAPACVIRGRRPWSMVGR